MTIYGHPKLGGTGRYPNGKLNGDDEGELLLAIAPIDGVVRMEFGSPVAWMGLYPANARAMAQALLAAADEAEIQAAKPRMEAPQ
jgi:hypothetical protein